LAPNTSQILGDREAVAGASLPERRLGSAFEGIKSMLQEKLPERILDLRHKEMRSDQQISR
jgi:hypothetical protein